ncbi:hypothetical protein GGQ86_001167 [Xanthobacter flavus]|uniref:DUF4148 domain-containing protein n=1 Tax=Xanthobacter flavus TaxID=281 RepID=A0A9W6CND8_XANFL|nr:hypothetical protein [Xanthobacter flavus]MDR6332703.1 hypothetical protein [Xanthobacter flavus]GLI20978.1 hypothetical protein XFLAVUS301_06520 [Xanthobacter flavus]
MKTLNTAKIIAAALIATGLSASATSAFADEYVTALNNEAHAVAAAAAAAYSDEARLPINAAPVSLQRQAAGSRIQEQRAQQFRDNAEATASSPFSDTDPHSGAAHGG